MIFGYLRECISDAFYKDYGVEEFAKDYPEVSDNVLKLFGNGGDTVRRTE